MCVFNGKDGLFEGRAGTGTMKQSVLASAISALGT